MKVYFMGSYVNGAINTPKNDHLFAELQGNFHDKVTYIGAQIDKESRMYRLMGKLRQDLKEADVLFLHPSRMNTSYFEIREALTLGKDIWMLCHPSEFAERGNYPYSLPNFKFIRLDNFKPLLALPTLEGLLDGLAKGEIS